MPTDRETASTEQAAREAAFTRARARLAAARGCPDAPSWRDAIAHVWPPRIALMVVCLSMAAFGYLLFIRGPEFQSGVLSSLALPTLILAWVLLFAKLWQQVFERRTSERAIVHAFFGALNAGRPPLRLARFFTKATSLHAARRVPEIAPVNLLPAAWRITTDIDTYWHGLTRQRGNLTRALVVRECMLIELAPDLKLARLRIAARPAGLLFDLHNALLIPAAMFVPFFSVMFARDPNLHGYLAAAMAVFVVLLLAHTAIQRVSDRNRMYTVNKLLVKRGGQWKLFCAEWEGWEEADLSWLDHVDQKHGN